MSGLSLWWASSGARPVGEGGGTPTFVAEARRLWSTEERLEFFAWIASEPDAGAVIKDSGGCRKDRWSRPGSSKRDGVRVICFTRLAAAGPRMTRQEIEEGIDQASQATKRRWGAGAEVPAVRPRDEGAQLCASHGSGSKRGGAGTSGHRHVAGRVRRRSEHLQAHAPGVGARPSLAVGCSTGIDPDRQQAPERGARGLGLTVAALGPAVGASPFD